MLLLLTRFVILLMVSIIYNNAAFPDKIFWEKNRETLSAICIWRDLPLWNAKMRMVAIVLYSVSVKRGFNNHFESIPDRTISKRFIKDCALRNYSQLVGIIIPETEQAVEYDGALEFIPKTLKSIIETNETAVTLMFSRVLMDILLIQKTYSHLSSSVNHQTAVNQVSLIIRKLEVPIKTFVNWNG